jgi:predicted phage-related endonuclease
MTKAQILELKDIEAQIAELKKKADTIKDEMKAEMGNDEHREVEGFKVNYTIVISTTLDSTKLKKELPDLWKKYSKEGITRRFSIT